MRVSEEIQQKIDAFINENFSLEVRQVQHNLTNLIHEAYAAGANNDNYDRIKKEVECIIHSTEPDDSDYHYNLQFGGHFDGKDRVFVGFKSGLSLRQLDKSRETLEKAKTALKEDGRFDAWIWMLRSDDYILIVQESNQA